MRGVIVELELPEGATLETGKIREEIGQLEGRAYKGTAVTVWDEDPTQDRAKVEWTVRAPKGGTLQVVAKHERAGKVQKGLTLS